MQPGDLVQLTCGSPVMTITGWEKDSWGKEGWGCVWSVQGAIRRDIFSELVLRLYDPEKPLATHTGRPKKT